MKRSVLIVDDEKVIRRMLTTMLELSGFQVLEAADGIEALNQVAEHQPDIVLLDIMMPKMDGLQVCRQLRSQESTADLPIIVFSGKGQQEAELEGLEAGANRFISKPAPPTFIVETITECLTQ